MTEHQRLGFKSHFKSKYAVFIFIVFNCSLKHLLKYCNLLLMKESESLAVAIKCSITFHSFTYAMSVVATYAFSYISSHFLLHLKSSLHHKPSNPTSFSLHLTNQLLLQYNLCFLAEDFGHSCSCCCSLSHLFFWKFTLLCEPGGDQVIQKQQSQKRKKQGSLGDPPQLFNYCSNLTPAAIETLVSPKVYCLYLFEKFQEGKFWIFF